MPAVHTDRNQSVVPDVPRPEQAYLLDLESLLRAWEDYWNHWLQGPTDPMAAGSLQRSETKLLAALHDPADRLPKAERQTWARLQQVCHSTLHVLRPTLPSKTWQHEITAERVRAAFQFQRECCAEIVNHRRFESEQDLLTQLPNRRRLLGDLPRLQARVDRAHLGCVAMIDIDHFKAINDQYGHDAGDRVLIHLGTRLRHLLRPYDGVYRYGGEEFLLLLPGIDAPNALILAQRLCRELAGQRIDLNDAIAIEATVSIGVCPLVPKGDPELSIRMADQALYGAKRGGRNRAELLRITPSAPEHTNTPLPHP